MASKKGAVPAPTSDVRQQIEIFVIFVFPAFAFAKLLFGFNELDPCDPLDHLVSELIFRAQAEGRAIFGRQRIAGRLRLTSI